jgi:hypothetical protein
VNECSWINENFKKSPTGLIKKGFSFLHFWLIIIDIFINIVGIKTPIRTCLQYLRKYRPCCNSSRHMLALRWPKRNVTQFVAKGKKPHAYTHAWRVRDTKHIPGGYAPYLLSITLQATHSDHVTHIPKWGFFKMCRRTLVPRWHVLKKGLSAI